MLDGSLLTCECLFSNHDSPRYLLRNHLASHFNGPMIGGTSPSPSLPPVLSCPRSNSCPFPPSLCRYLANLPAQSPIESRTSIPCHRPPPSFLPSLPLYIPPTRPSPPHSVTPSLLRLTPPSLSPAPPFAVLAALPVSRAAAAAGKPRG